MKARSVISSLLLASLAFPPRASAQAPAAPVQPVPYAPSQPVPYPGTAAADAPVVVNVPRATPPSPVGSDVVHLKGGGMIRGTLIESIPNDHASVALASGQTAVIPWDRVARIDRAGASSAPAAPVAPASVPPAPRGPEGSALVHIDSDSPVSLERRDGRAWVPACSAPCDVELPLSGEYRVNGPSVRNTAPFHLNASPGERIVLDVNSASKGAFIGGIVVTGVGGFVLLTGAFVLYYEAMLAQLDSGLGNQGYSQGNSGANAVGWVMVAGGAAAALVGVLVLASNAHSKVEQSGAPHPRNDAWLRVPQWREDKTGAALPRVVGVPLFQTTF